MSSIDSVLLLWDQANIKTKTHGTCIEDEYLDIIQQDALGIFNKILALQSYRLCQYNVQEYGHCVFERSLLTIFSCSDVVIDIRAKTIKCNPAIKLILSKFLREKFMNKYLKFDQQMPQSELFVPFAKCTIAGMYIYSPTNIIYIFFIFPFFYQKI